jgi:hypothetical protein
MGCGKYCATGALASSDYSILSHGDIGAHYNSVVNADLPKYTSRFYQPTHHESMADLKYSKIEIGYDKGLRQFSEAAKGAPMEAYIPVSVVVPDGVGSSSVIIRDAEVVPKKAVVDEILKAQAQVIGKKEPVIVRMTEVEQEIHLKRKLRKVEIFKKNQE